MHPTPEALALFALGEDVDPEVTEHVRSCLDCRTEVEAWARVVSVGRSITSEDVLTEPHERVWSAVSREIGRGSRSTVTHLPTASDSGSPPAGATPATESAGRSPRRRWPAIALAAALALILGVGLGVGLSRVLARTDVVGVTQLNALPEWRGSNGTATVQQDDAGNRTLVITAQIPATTPVNGTMEVWLGDSYAEDMVPMGVLTGPSGRFPVPKSMDLKAHPIVDVSLEPKGDTNPAHSDNSMLRGRLAL